MRLFRNLSFIVMLVAVILVKYSSVYADGMTCGNVPNIEVPGCWYEGSFPNDATCSSEELKMTYCQSCCRTCGMGYIHAYDDLCTPDDGSGDGYLDCVCDTLEG